MLTKIMLEHIPAPAAEAWRNEYRGRRYLRRLGIGELRARLIYLARSLITLKPDGRLGLLGQEVPLWQAFAETCEEAALRRESVDELLKGVKMPDSDFARTLQTLDLPANRPGERDVLQGSELAVRYAETSKKRHTGPVLNLSSV
jgi:hypothetical protein